MKLIKSVVAQKLWVTELLNEKFPIFGESLILFARRHTIYQMQQSFYLALNHIFKNNKGDNASFLVRKPCSHFVMIPSLSFHITKGVTYH